MAVFKVLEVGVGMIYWYDLWECGKGRGWTGTGVVNVPNEDSESMWAINFMQPNIGAETRTRRDEFKRRKEGDRRRRESGRL